MVARNPEGLRRSGLVAAILEEVADGGIEPL